MPNLSQDKAGILLEVKSKRKFDAHEMDPGLRVTEAVSSYIQLNIQRCWRLIENILELAIHHLIELAQPSPLRTVLEINISLSRASFRKNFVQFVKTLRVMAI